MSEQNQDTNTPSTPAPSTPAPTAAPAQTQTALRWKNHYDPTHGWVTLQEQVELTPERKPEPEESDEQREQREDAERAIEREQEQRDRERAENATPEALGLEVPDIGLDNLKQMEVSEYLGELAPIVAARGINPTEVNDMIAYATDLVVTDTSGVDLLNRAACEVHARNYFGESFEKTVELAQRASAKLGPEFQEWLNTGGKGNSVGVIAALAAWESGMLKMSPATAQAELQQMIQPGSPYMRGDRSAVNRVRLLSELANGPSSKLAPTARTEMRPAPDPTSALAAERERLMRSAAFLDKKNPQHRATLERYKEVTEALHGRSS